MRSTYRGSHVSPSVAHSQFPTLTAAERRGSNVKGFNDFYLEAKTGIWLLAIAAEPLDDENINPVLVSQKVFIKLFFESQFPHESVD